MSQLKKQFFRQQLTERLVKAGLSESKAKETLDNLLSAYCLTRDYEELVREIEEMAMLFEEESIYEIAKPEKSKHNIA